METKICNKCGIEKPLSEFRKTYKQYIVTNGTIIAQKKKLKTTKLGELMEDIFISDEIGFVDNECLKNYYNFIVSGGVFKKSDFLAVGSLKNNIKVFFWYELLLRMTHNDKRVYVIPKIGYEHYVNVVDSLSNTFMTMDNKELDFWFSTAQEEYLYKTDRKKVYTQETQNNDAN